MTTNKKNPNIHTISVLVANKPGVLVRCALVFARRGINIDALVVSPSVDPRFSRMTITAKGDLQTLEQIIKQSAKLIDVIHVSEHTGKDSIDREFALFKIDCPKAKRAAILKALKSAKAKILDETQSEIILSKDGTTDELDRFEEVLKKFRIIEMVRSGKLAMAKGKQET